MKHKRVSTLAAILLFASGCALFDSTAAPERRYLDAVDTYNFTVATAIDLKVAEKISPDDWRNKINPAIQEGRQILRELRQALDACELDKLDILKASLVRIVTRLQGTISES